MTGTVVMSANVEEAQNVLPVNQLYVNILGDASLISVNCERLYFTGRYVAWTAKTGLAYNEDFAPMSDSPLHSYITIPHHFTGNFGVGRHFGGWTGSHTIEQPY